MAFQSLCLAIWLALACTGIHWHIFYALHGWYALLEFARLAVLMN